MTRVALPLFALLALLCAVGLPAAAMAQRPPAGAPSIEVTVAFTPPQVSIGDRVTMTVTARHAADVIVDAPAPQIDHLDVRDTGTPVTRDDPAGGGQITTFTWTVQPFLLEPIATGPVRLSWLRADGSNGDLAGPATTLIVTPTRSEKDEQLRPLKPQLGVAGAPPAWVRPAIYGAATLAVVIIAALVTLWVRRRRARHVEAPVIDVSPERTAREALDMLVAGAHDDESFQHYYGGIALAVRQYLSARFGFNAHALTTTELEQRMIAHGVDRWQARLVGGLLERCDAAIFARQYPNPASADHDLTVAYEIVELSRPQAAATPAPEAVPA